MENEDMPKTREWLMNELTDMLGDSPFMDAWMAHCRFPELDAVQNAKINHVLEVLADVLEEVRQDNV